MTLPKILQIVIVTTLCCLDLPAAWGLEYRSVVQQGAPLHSQPKHQAPTLFLLSRGYPLEVVEQQGGWMRVRDVSGLIAWIEQRALTRQRTVLAQRSGLLLRAAPRTDATLLARVDKGVVLQLLDDPQQGWVHVRHRDGLEGYLAIDGLWGL